MIGLILLIVGLIAAIATAWCGDRRYKPMALVPLTLCLGGYFAMPLLLLSLGAEIEVIATISLGVIAIGCAAGLMFYNVARLQHAMRRAEISAVE